MRTTLLALALFTFASALTFAAAASHGVTADDFGSGSVEVHACDTNGVVIEMNLDLEDDTVIESLVVSDIDSQCITQIMTIALTAVDGYELWSTEVYVDQLLIDVPIVDGAGVPVIVDAGATARASITITERVAFS